MPARRTCAACRLEADRDELVRLVLAPDGAVVVDYRGKLPGRGGWVHATADCVGKIDQKPGLLSRAFKGPVRASGLGDSVRAAVIEAALSGVSIAAAGGAAIGGHDVLATALDEGSILAVAVASDASERTIESLRRRAGPDVPFVSLPFDKQALGGAAGQAPRAAIGAASAHAGRYLAAQLRRLARLG